MADGPEVEIRGRRNECQALDRLLAGARAGRSAALVLRGEAGIGKTELLKYLIRRSDGCRIVRAVGVESDMELSYAGLHQLCAPLQADMERLPVPQRDALSTVFGLQTGNVPDRFLVGLGALSLLAQAGEVQPLVCIIDDAQWLDHASALTLAFVARRLVAESVLLVLAVREPAPGGVRDGLPDLWVRGLPDGVARTLLESVLPGRLDERVRERILVEARGNPLALLELPRGAAGTEMAAALVVGDELAMPSQMEQAFLQRVQALPIESRRMLSIAAADPMGDVALVRRAAARLGLDVDAALSHPEASEFLALGTLVRFRHPLVRSAAYRATPVAERRATHRALAESLDAEVDPDRRAWHRAEAASGPDESVAADLERSAARAQSRGGHAAAAVFLERAAALSQDRGSRSRRALEAAQATLQAGAFEPAAALLAMAGAGPDDELRSARIELLKGQVAFAQGRGNEAIPLLLAAARRLQQLDVGLARETYLEALFAAISMGHLASGPGQRQVGEAVREAPSPQVPNARDGLLDALARRTTDGYAPSVPMIEGVLAAFCDDETPVRESVRWISLAGILAADLWSLERWEMVSARQVALIRQEGELSELPIGLDSRAVVHVFAGELTTAAAVIEEVNTVSAAIGSPQPGHGALALAAIRGREAEARTLIDATISQAETYGLGLILTVAHFHHAVLCNGLAQYEEAVIASQAAASHDEQFGAPHWALAELIEAAPRIGAHELAFDALEKLSETTRASGTDWALGVEARSRALLSHGSAAEDLFQEAIERLSRTRVRVHLARTHLLYGEWLRRENRRADSRAALSTAHEMLTQFGAEAYAERARRELQATGAKVRKRVAAVPTALTAQEQQIARLAGDGLTNPEIGTRLFLSPHTVEWHLRKVFTKLGISSRREISHALLASAVTSA